MDQNKSLIGFEGVSLKNTYKTLMKVCLIAYRKSLIQPKVTLSTEAFIHDIYVDFLSIYIFISKVVL